MIAAVLVTGLLIVLLFHPNWPQMADRGQFDDGEKGQHPTAAQCEAATPASIITAVKKQKWAENCANDAERYREEKEGRWQTVRAAQAAEQTTFLTYDQAMIALIGLVVLIAAFAASVWAAMAAIRAAEAADETLDHARKTAERELRAYVFVEDAKIAVIGEMAQEDKIVGAVWRASYTVKNAGSTPAHKVKVLDCLTVQDWIPDRLPLPMSDDYFGSMAPNGDVIDADSDDLTTNPADGAAVTSKEATKAVFLVGKIFYDDVFGFARETDFCFFWKGPIDDTPQQMTAYNEGNDST